MAVRAKTRDLSSLYKSEDEIARLVLGDDLKQWKALAAVWEREGLPRIDPMTGRRFWPAVERFLYRRHGLSSEIVPSRVDGIEQWQ
jgi:hypothetical protein